MSRSGQLKIGGLKTYLSLNPSFSGCPALGLNLQYNKSSTSCLNPSFSGCPALGLFLFLRWVTLSIVLIPLLVDVPLWGILPKLHRSLSRVLIPLLVDVPLWAMIKNFNYPVILVLIPLLVDVPLWDYKGRQVPNSDVKS